MNKDLEKLIGLMKEVDDMAFCLAMEEKTRHYIKIKGSTGYALNRLMWLVLSIMESEIDKPPF